MNSKMLVSSTIGSIPDIIENAEGLYKGDLRHYAKAVLTARNLNSGYHNFGHIFGVVYRCYLALKFYSEKNDPIDLVAARALLIAAIFHDYDHTGRSGNDDVNITLALRGLKKHLLPEDNNIFVRLMVKMIQATEYPYRVPSDELGLLEQIIRDADASQVFSPSWIQPIVFGLGSEMGVSPVDMLGMQGGFLGSLKFATEWAKATFPMDVIAAKAIEAKRLRALFS